MLADDIYKTIEEQGEAIYTEKRSKFLAFAIPVTTIEEVKTTMPQAAPLIEKLNLTIQQ